MKRGRPTLPEGERKRFNLTFRVRAELREKLATAANSNGRSISEEIEAQLERAVHRDNMEARMEGIDAMIEELLAIKFYEHAFVEWPPAGETPWLQLTDEDKATWRQMARDVRKRGHP